MVEIQPFSEEERERTLREALTPLELKALLLLLDGKSVNETARQVGVHPNTVTRWRTQPQHAAFQAAYRAAMKDRKEWASFHAATSSADVVGTMMDIALGKTPIQPHEAKAARLRLKAMTILLDTMGIVKQTR